MESFLPSQKEIEERTDDTFRHEKTYNGYNVSDLKSWLQKSIRRCKIEDAVFAAVELYTFPKQSVVTNLFNRLRVISMEDVGLANPEAVKYTDDILESLQTKGKPSLPVKEKGVKKIAKLAVYLATSKHIRIVSDYNAVFLKYNLRELIKERYPDIFSEKDDEIFEKVKEIEDPKILGKKMLDAIEKKKTYALYYMKKILDMKTLPFKSYSSAKSPYYVMELFKKFVKDHKLKFDPCIDILVKWLKGGIINSKIDNNLPIYYAALFLLKRDELKVDKGAQTKIPKIINFDEGLKPPKIPSYAIDKHTISGLRAGKTTVDFAKEGSLVENEDLDLLNPVYRKIYVDSKTWPLKSKKATAPKKESKKTSPKKESRKKESKKTSPKKVSGKIPLESDYVDFDVRAQATVADSRACTYFGTEKSTGKSIFVKGPYKDEKAAETSIKIVEIKKILDPDMPYIDIKKIKLKPDLFPDVPWGFRRHTDRNKGYWFVIADNVIPLKHLPRKIHTTKVWGDVEVIDWGKIKEPKTPQVLKLKDKELGNYVFAILFRYALGIPDEADRNFMQMKDGTIYSVDEEGLNADTNFCRALKKKRCEMIREFIKDNKKNVKKRVCKWIVEYVKNKDEIEKILGEDSYWLFERLKNLKEDASEIFQE